MSTLTLHQSLLDKNTVVIQTLTKDVNDLLDKNKSLNYLKDAEKLNFKSHIKRNTDVIEKLTQDMKVLKDENKDLKESLESGDNNYWQWSLTVLENFSLLYCIS